MPRRDAGRFLPLRIYEFFQIELLAYVSSIEPEARLCDPPAARSLYLIRPRPAMRSHMRDLIELSARHRVFSFEVQSFSCLLPHGLHEFFQIREWHRPKLHRPKS